MIELEQAFYGRDAIDGYRLLASSANNSRQEGVVSRLCAAIGTPDGSSSCHRSYINFVEGELRYMIGVTSGNIGDANRKTLFFHAFIGNNSQLNQNNFGIGSLIALGAFRDNLPEGDINACQFKEKFSKIEAATTTIDWRGEKIAIVSSHDELNLLAGIMGEAIDTTSWASFCYRDVEEFQVYVLSEYVHNPLKRKCYATNGKLISPSREKTPPILGIEQSSSKAGRGKAIGLLGVLLVLSLMANIFFISGVIPFRKGSGFQQGGSEVTREQMRKDVLSDLRKKFEADGYTKLAGSWQDSAKSDGRLKYNYDKIETLKIMGGYVEFVQKNIFTEEEAK